MHNWLGLILNLQFRRIFFNILFCFQVRGKTMVFQNIFNSAHLKKFNLAIFTVLKEFILRNGSLGIFWIPLTIQKIFRKEKNTFLTVHTLFFTFFRNMLLVNMNRCKMSYNKDKLVLFFPQKDESMDKTLRKF